MTRRRLLTIVAALVLATIGVVIIVAYVNSAEQRALEGSEVVPVLVAAADIPENTPASQLNADQLVRTDNIPQRLVPNDAVRDVASLGDQVVISPILEGEEIVERQFGDAGEVRSGPARDIPESKEIVTVALEPQRAVGGRLSPGDTVSVLISLDAAEVTDEANPSATRESDAATKVVLSGVPVTSVDGGVSEEDGQAQGTVVVGLEVDGLDAETVVFGQEHGRVWLALEGDNVAAPDGEAQTRERVLQGGGGS